MVSENGAIRDDDEEQDDIEGDSGEIRVSRKGTLSKFVKSKVESRISADAKETLMAQLEQITMILVKRAEEVGHEKGRNTIYPADLEESYEELMSPHAFIETVLDTLEKQKEELKRLAASSLVRHMEVD